jgi:hypothetical protein
MKARLLARYAWASPATVVGLLLSAVALAAGARGRRRDGVLEMCGGRIGNFVRALPRRCRFRAITFGHVVLAVDAEAIDATRTHERVHVRQYERWGPLFFPAYAAWSACAWLRGGDPYRDNPFEREAFASDDERRCARPDDRDHLRR